VKRKKEIRLTQPETDRNQKNGRIWQDIFKNRLALLGLILLSVPLLVSAQNASEPSTNPVLRKLEDEFLPKTKKGKPEEQADAFYDLGKSCFENHDITRAEYYMRQAADRESQLKRVEQSITTNVALAMILSVEKKYDDAVSYYKKALESATRNKLDESAATIIDSLGSLSLKNNKLDEADQYYKKAYELAEQNKNIAGQMNSLTNQATVLRKRNQPEQALQLLQKAVELSARGDEDRTVGLALVNAARVHYDLDKLNEAVSEYKKAIDIFKKEADFESQADACKGLADTYFDLQKMSEAKSSYQEGVDALRDEPDGAMKIDLLNGLGCAEADLGNFETAQKYHQQAHDMSVSLKNRAEELSSLLQMGYDYLLSGYPEAGLYRLLDAEKLIKQGGLDARHKANFLVAIGRCYKTLGQVESSETYYNEALKLYEDINDDQDRGLSLVSLSVLALDNENQAAFEKYSSAARALFTGDQDKRHLAILDYNHGQYLLTQGKYADAVADYERALGQLKGSSDRVSEGMVLRGLGLAYLASDRPQQALGYYEKALSMAEQSGQIEALWDSHLGIGKCNKKLGLNERAIEHLSQAVELVEKERGHLTRDSFKTFNLDLRNDCFLELVDVYVRTNQPYNALATAEKGRARAFLDMLSSRHAGRKVETFDVPLSSQAQPASTSLLASAKPEAGTRGVSVIPRASQIYASSAVSPTNAAAPNIPEIKALVQNSKSTVLEYYMLPDKIVVWVIDPDSNIHMLPPIPLSRQQVTEKVSLAYEAITHQPKNQEEVALLARRRQDLLRELNDFLIKPVESSLPKDEQAIVTIVPHGPLFMVPFAALLSQDGKFFVEKHTIAYSPAIGVMRATQKLEQTASNQTDRLLAFGNPITKAIAFLGTLPYSEKEVKNIAGLFGEQNSVVKIGQDANKRTFEELAPQFGEVHLATHGLVDEEHPMQSSLILAPTSNDDGLLTVKDILAMKELKAKLVVLSACQTGRGKITGDGIIGLSRAFIIAGTPSVLVSQWNVDDIVTEFQMKSFYKSYLAHVGKSKSLRQAQLDTIKLLEGNDGPKDGIRANPRYWGAFQLMGACG
jgi:CHAT domain-containing protein/tetratricopeptide (TPR) repeat protein